MSLQRSFLRYSLKQYTGTNKIFNAWRRFQIKRYGIKALLKMYLRNKGGRPKSAYAK